MCINPVVSTLPNGAKAAACKALVDKKGCSFHVGSESNLLPNKIDAVNIHAAKHEIMDIEDLISFGKKKR